MRVLIVEARYHQSVADVCIGNGVPAAEPEDEALQLADFSRGDAGEEAARACLALMQWRARLAL